MTTAIRTEKIELNPRETVLVIGGYGFIGRHIVEKLETLGADILIGTRGRRKPREPGARKVELHKLRAKRQWVDVLEGVDVVVNAVGILRQGYAQTYEQVHHRSVEALAHACADRDIRLVHISALGLDNPVRSRFLTSKRRGEQAIMNSAADWHLVRPSLVDGEGGYGAKWLRRVASWPVHFAPANATKRITPINAKDLGEAVARIALKVETPDNSIEDDTSRIYELGGGQTLDMMSYLQCLAAHQPYARVRVPAWLARLSAHVFDLLHVTPLSFGHYELLKFDNCPEHNRLGELIARPARVITPSQTPTVLNSNPALTCQMGEI